MSDTPRPRARKLVHQHLLSNPAGPAGLARPAGQCPCTVTPAAPR